MNLQTRAEKIVPLSNNTIQVQIGEVCCSITCSDRDVFGYLKELYSNFLSDRPADINIQLETVDELGNVNIQKLISQALMTQKGNRFVSTHLTLESEYDAVNRSLSMKVDKRLFDLTQEYKLMNRVLNAAYFTAIRGEENERKPPDMLVHACGAIRHGRVLVFTGPSGTGKTTIGRLCGDKYGQVINDEMVLVSWPAENDTPVIVQGAPVIGELDQRLNVKAPLGCIILLKQSPRTAFRRLNRLEAYTRFIRQVIWPAGLEHEEQHRLLSLTTDFGDEITRNTALYELEFNLDRQLLWKVVDELEKSLEKGVPAK